MGHFLGHWQKTRQWLESWRVPLTSTSETDATPGLKLYLSPSNHSEGTEGREARVGGKATSVITLSHAAPFHCQCEIVYLHGFCEPIYTTASEESVFSVGTNTILVNKHW